MSGLKLIVGIGNPGKEYEYTRHNLGFLVVRRLAEEYKVGFQLSSFTNGLTTEGKIGNLSFCFLMPLTYVNNSGIAVRNVVEAKKIDLSDILVVSDDLNLDFGELRIKPKGTDGGHNGLKSIIEKLGSKDFARLRLGIGQPKNKSEIVDYVLEPFAKKEQKELDHFISQAVQCCNVWLKESVSKAMDQFNRREKNGKE